MKRNKKLLILLGVLVIVAAAAVLVTRIGEKKEEIAESGEVVLAIDPDSVTAFGWNNGTEDLAFSKKDEGWSYDGDEAFPVSDDSVQELLETFREFSADFIIEKVEDFGQYGLEDPMCTINITTDEGTITITLGDYSSLDAERYVSIGDGNVYLAVADPYNYFSVGLDYMMENASIPYYERVEKLTFEGKENYSISYEEDAGRTFYEDDTYYANIDGEELAVDPAHVESYMYNLEYLGLGNYVKYGVTEDDLGDYFLSDPDLAIKVDYSYENEDEKEITGSFKVLMGWDPEQKARIKEEEAAAEEAGEDYDSSDEELDIYAMVEGTPIIYRITQEEYNSLMAASYNDMKHREVVQARFEDISSIKIKLDGKNYEFMASEAKDEEDITYTFEDEEIDISDIENAMEALKAADASAYTEEKHGSNLEVSFTVEIKEEARGTDTGSDIKVDIYTYDGENCLVCVDNKSFALVKRSLAVDFIEAVRAIVL